MTIKRRILQKISQTDFAQKAVRDQADLSAFRKRPTPRIILGVSAILFSYVMGWPAVSALGALSIYFREPLVVAIGGPVTYGLSHLVFLAGMYLAGAKYTKIFLRWATRVALERLNR